MYLPLHTALRYVPDLLIRGFHFCSFDFAGCGNSPGEYVSLGYNER
jgi:alpha-beta hydrolase superfamily lysophospholipase